MCKKIAFIVLISVAFCNLLRGQEPVTLYDGTVLNKGDMLTIGHKKSNSYSTIKEKITNEYNRVQYPSVKEDMAYLKVNITGFITPEKPEIFPSKSLIVLAKNEKTNKDLYIEIDKAVETGEVISELAEPIYKDAVYLSDDLLMACVIKVNQIPVTDNVLLSFIGTKDKELQKRCRADEFELNKTKPQYLEILNKLMDGFDFSTTYYITTDLEIGKYDFSAGGYTLAILSGDNTFLRYGYNGAYNFIIENNREKYHLLPVPEAKAEIINKRRKGTGKFAYISSLVYGKFYLKLLDKRMELPKNDIINMENKYRHTVVGAELLGLEVYDYPHCEYNLIGTIK